MPQTKVGVPVSYNVPRSIGEAIMQAAVRRSQDGAQHSRLLEQDTRLRMLRELQEKGDDVNTQTMKIEAARRGGAVSQRDLERNTLAGQIGGRLLAAGG